MALAIAAIWFTHYLVRNFSATRVHQTLDQVGHRVDRLAQDAVRLNVVASRQLDLERPLSEQTATLMVEMSDLFDLYTDLSYLGLGVEATGEYSMLRRRPESRASRNREYVLLPDGSRAIRDYAMERRVRRIEGTLEWDGYDPRTRPFYQAAKAAGHAVWTDSYSFWGRHEQGAITGITYAQPLYDSRSNLVGVLDVDFDLVDLSRSLRDMARDSAGYSFILEERADGGRVVVAHPDPQLVTEPGTRLLLTNTAAIRDPIVRAVLEVLSPTNHSSVAGASVPDVLRAGTARYFWEARRFEGPGLPRWRVVTVLPVAVVLRETLPVYLWLGAGALLLLLLSGILAGRVARYVTGPLRQLQEQLDQPTSVAGLKPVVVTGPQEFRHLAGTFNRLIGGLAERGKELMETNRQLQAEIEQRHLAEVALRDSQEKFQKAFNSSPDAIVLATLTEGRYLEVNESFCRLFGYTREEALQRTSAEVLYTDPVQRQAVLEAVRQHGCLRDYEIRTRRKDGTEFEATLSIEPILIQGQPHLLGIARDITERKAAAAELKRHQERLEELVRERTSELSRINLVLATEVDERKRIESELRTANDRLKELDRLKSEFLATMSHELRTPLNSIIGFTGILRQRLAGPLTPEQDKQLGMVQGSARHLLGLINDLLDLSRIESGKMEMHLERFPVEPLLHDVVKTLEPLAVLKKLPLRIELEPPGFELCSDRKKVFQVLLNLANNAVKFTERGEVLLQVNSEPGFLRFTVRDTGIGVKPEHMKLLFEAFRQVDGSARRVYEGTGLGLYLCQKLVSLLGGEIRAQSEFGKGSEFWFTVPTNREEIPNP